MAFRVKCKVCGSCMSPMWKNEDRYLYCGFCRQYYAGQLNSLQRVDSPFTLEDSIKMLNTGRTRTKVEDPNLEEQNNE